MRHRTCWPATLIAAVLALSVLGVPQVAVAADFDAAGLPSMLMPWDSTNTTVTFSGGPHNGSTDNRCSAVNTITGASADASAVDFAMAEGTPVLSVAPGKVSKAWDPSDIEGKSVRIDHGNGTATEYWHLSSIDPAIQAAEGTPQVFPRGTRLGKSGYTTYYDESGTLKKSQHLHLDFRTWPSRDRISAHGVEIDGYAIRFLVRTSADKGFNYQGTLTLGAETTALSSDICSGATEWRGSSTTIYAGSGTTLRSTNSISSPSPNEKNVDVVLVIDSSSSMDSNDGGNKRLEAAQAYLTASPDGDRVAVVDFATNARVVRPLVAMPGGRQSLLDAIWGVGSSGSTNIHDAITTACDELVANGKTANRGAILLTDGEHTSGTFDNPQRCFVDRGWPIYSIGFGSADLDFLRAISNPTGGDAKMNGSVTSLVCEFQAVRAKIAGAKPPVCDGYHVDPKTSVFRKVWVKAGQALATFSNSWSGSDIVMTLTSPSGRKINRGTKAADVVHDKGAAFEIYSITKPEKGTWKVRLYAKDVPPAGEDAVFAFSTLTAPPSTKLVDDRHKGFSKYGSRWQVQKVGYRQRSFWTTVRRSGVRRYAIWKTAIDAPGRYEVVVKIPKRSATTRKAKYKIFTSDGPKVRKVDQKLVQGRRFGVPAIVGRDTGVGTSITVRMGDVFRIRASGKWCMGPGECGSSAGIRPANPDEPDLRVPGAEDRDADRSHRIRSVVRRRCGPHVHRGPARRAAPRLQRS